MKKMSLLQHRLLVVDDDKKLRDLLVNFLKRSGFDVDAASNAPQARSFLALQPYDLIILDIMMPGEDGLTFLNSIREHNTYLPVLILSAKGTTTDRIEGLSIGADDFLPKPFEPEELVLRIKTILKRVIKPTLVPKQIKIGQYALDPDRGILKNAQGFIDLSSTEQILLKTLAQHPGKAFAREDLSQRLGHVISERAIDVQITRLRRKIGDDPKHPRYIQTVRHIGYAFYPDEE